MDRKSAATEIATDSARAERTILIVEDSPVQAEMLRRALEGAGYKVIVAVNGAEGLAMAKANHPDAVVSDINMPAMDGYAMCQAIRGDESLKSSPVILLTILSGPEDVIHGLNAGADCYVTKPYSGPYLLSRLEEMLAESPARDEAPIKIEAKINKVPFQVRAGPKKVLDLLISTYENAVLQNRDLVAVQDTLAASNEQLEHANEELAREIDRRNHLQDQLHKTNEELNVSVGKLQQRNAHLALLDTMVNRLQACRSLEETCAVVADSMPRLFPSCPGLLALADEQGRRFSVAASWNGIQTGPRAWSQDECPALRGANLRIVDGVDPHLACARACGAQDTAYLCMPLMAHGEMLGLVHVQGTFSAREARDSATAAEQEARILVINAAAKTIGLAIANLRLQEDLRQQSLRDPLTRLYNRRFLQGALEREAARARRSGTPLGVVMLDIDHFKRINDSHGHVAGDLVLEWLGQFLQDSVRGEDVACRYGGEEFILLLPGATVENAALRAEQIRAGVEAGSGIQFDDHLIGPVTVSLGVTAFYLDPNGQACVADAVQAADEALLRAKQQGRNRVGLADTTIGSLSKAVATDIHTPRARPTSNSAGVAGAGRP